MRTIGSTGKKTWLAAFIALVMALAAISATAATDARELKAREDFAAGRYQDALELFAKLYAESLHPNYLRNIGRCYQNLGDPDHAITSFRDYLRKAKSINADERKEVEGYISEMEALKRQKESAAATPAPTPPPPAATTTQPVTPIASDSAKAPGANANVSVVLTAPPPPPPPAPESPPVYGRWWFWAIIGGAVAAGLGAAAAAGVFTKTQDASCGGFKCN